MPKGIFVKVNTDEVIKDYRDGMSTNKLGSKYSCDPKRHMDLNKDIFIRYEDNKDYYKRLAIPEWKLDVGCLDFQI